MVEMKTKQRPPRRYGPRPIEEHSPDICRVVLNRFRKGAITEQAICGLDISAKTARRLAKDAHINLLRGWPGKRTPKPASARNRQIAQFIREQCTLADTGTFFGLTRQRVLGIIERQGIQVVPANGAGRDWPAWESASAHVACGGSVEEAAWEAGVVEASVRFICHELGVVLP